MMKILDKLANVLMILLPFLKKSDAKKVQEFTDLVKGQFDYLMEQVTKFETDYFELSEKVRQMYQEMIKLNEQLATSLKLQCTQEGCRERKQDSTALSTLH